MTPIAEGENADLAEYKHRTRKKPKLPRTSCRHVVDSLLQKGVKSGGRSQIVKVMGLNYFSSKAIKPRDLWSDIPGSQNQRLLLFLFSDH